ncbi:MAG: hypothetical protein PHV74_01685 [Dehalococcoidia bacterium]|nr:hypothetical protein [Dehalococcoidia bacterium]
MTRVRNEDIVKRALELRKTKKRSDVLEILEEEFGENAPRHEKTLYLWERGVREGTITLKQTAVQLTHEAKAPELPKTGGKPGTGSTWTVQSLIKKGVSPEIAGWVLAFVDITEANGNATRQKVAAELIEIASRCPEIPFENAKALAELRVGGHEPYVSMAVRYAPWQSEQNQKAFLSAYKQLQPDDKLFVSFAGTVIETSEPCEMRGPLPVPKRKKKTK